MKRKKKTFPMRTTLLLLLMMLTSLSVWANETFTVGDLTYIVVSESSKTVNVRNYSGTMPENYNMVIPASVTNPNNSTLYTVIGIDSNAFANKTNLTSVSIPASMTRINQQAFEGCTNLETVSIPEANGVTDVGDAAFSGTKWLNDQPNGVVYVGKVAYLGKNVSGDVSINDGAVSISDEAFLNCTGLTSVTIPNSVTYIGSSAFFGCTNLTSITIPNSVTYIGGSAFSGSGLTSITIPNGVTDIGYEAFKGCISLTSITIPASVQTIINGAFYGCTNLKTVTIYAPSCYLGTDAFRGCNGDLQIYVFSDLVNTYKGAENWSKYAGIIKGLTGGYCGVDDPTTDGVDESTNVVWVLTGASPNYTLTIGGTGKMASYSSVDQYPWNDYRSSITSLVFESGVTSVCDGAFSGYSNLTSVTFQQGVETIGHSAFSSCSGLKSISIPNSVTTIYSGAFSGCTNVETLELGSGLTTIEAGVFSGLTSLTSLTIGDGVKTIEAGAFMGCTGLKNLTIGDGVTSIAGVFNNCTNLETIVLGAGLTFLNAGSFDGYTKLKSVTFKNGTSPLHLPAAVFRGCTSLETVTLPNNVTQIGTNAFSGCTSLTSMNIPASVTSIGESVFYNCTNLTSVALNGPATIGSGAFPLNTTVTIASGLYLHNGSEVLCGDVTDMSKLNDHILNVAIPYIDEDGTMAYRTDYFVIDGSTTYFDNGNGWYVVNSNVTLNWLRFPGNANIILCDGAKLTVKNNNVRGDITAQNLSSASITVYAQSAGTGAIEAGAIKSSASDITAAFITIYGGNIDINRLEAGFVNIYGGSITVNTAENQTEAAILGNAGTRIYGGSVTVTATGCNGIESGNQGYIHIYGGQVTATATGTGCYGISSKDDIQLGWTKATDFIQASSYKVGQNCDVDICDGQMMSDGTTIYSDNLDAQKDAIAGQKLVPYGFKTKANPHENDYWTSFYYGTANYSAPDGVTIYKAAIDGDHVQLTEVSGGIIRAGEAVILKTTASNVTTDGYLILPLTTTDATGDYSGNELKGVDVDTWQEDGYTYYVLSKKGDNFGFYKLASSKRLGAHKAFIEVAPSNNAPAFYGFDDSDSEDGIENVNVNDNVNDNAIYNLAGQKLSKPQKGINIINGRKVLF